MKLEELKGFLGIPLTDTSKDAKLQLELDAAMEQAREYTNKYDWENWNDGFILPSTIRLGIVRWVELALERRKHTGIASKSMAGMSVTYKDNDKEYFGEVFQLWGPFRKKGLNFRPARKRGRSDILSNIPDDVTITGTRKL